MRFDKLAQYALAAAGVLALGFCGAEFVESYLYEATEARNFDRELQELHIREEIKGPRGTLQNRPMRDTSKPANETGPGQELLYLVGDCSGN